MLFKDLAPGSRFWNRGDFVWYVKLDPAGDFIEFFDPPHDSYAVSEEGLIVQIGYDNEVNLYVEFEA